MQSTRIRLAGSMSTSRASPVSSRRAAMAIIENANSALASTTPRPDPVECVKPAPSNRSAKARGTTAKNRSLDATSGRKRSRTPTAHRTIASKGRAVPSQPPDTSAARHHRGVGQRRPAGGEQRATDDCSVQDRGARVVARIRATDDQAEAEHEHEVGGDPQRVGVVQERNATGGHEQRARPLTEHDQAGPDDDPAPPARCAAARHRVRDERPDDQQRRGRGSAGPNRSPARPRPRPAPAAHPRPGAPSAPGCATRGRPRGRTRRPAAPELRPADSTWRASSASSSARRTPLSPARPGDRGRAPRRGVAPGPRANGHREDR